MFYLKSERYGKIRCFGKKHYVFCVDFPIGATVRLDELAVRVGSPFVYKEYLTMTVKELFKDITGAKVYRYDDEMIENLYQKLCTVTLRKNSTHGVYQYNSLDCNYKESIEEIFNQHPIPIQSMGGKITMIVRFTLNEPFRIAGTERAVFNYADEKWLFYYDLYGRYSVENILDWKGITSGDTERTWGERLREKILEKEYIKW